MAACPDGRLAEYRPRVRQHEPGRDRRARNLIGSAPSIRSRMACWLHERWRTELVLRFPTLTRSVGWSWLDLRNRLERLRYEEVSGGRVCLWADSSTLSVARIFPPVATRLAKQAIARWPIRFDASPSRRHAARPSVSILIPIGGTERVRQFQLTLAAARAQNGIEVELIVVEQGTGPLLAGGLPTDVRYLHQVAAAGTPFNKSRALNGAARIAVGEVLIILDADYLLPESFASEAFRVLRRVEAARPARLIFYIDEVSSTGVSAASGLPPALGIERVVANNPTPIAVRRSTYWEIGGHDESYFGWGGEDTEFLDRLRVRRMSEGGWMPVLHVWHPAAPKKQSGDRNRELHDRTMSIPAAERIRRLTAQATSEGTIPITSAAKARQ